MPINPLSYFYPRSLHERIGWYDEQDHYSHDIDFLIRASRHLRPVHIEAVIGEFRMVAGSKTLTTIEDGTLQQRKLAVIQRHRRQLSARERLLLNAWRLRNKVMGLVPGRR
ncbi:MAG: hypothetical protein NTW83_01540 [Cyanobacteria bacterium]|nr:hypothetical protein [Cyanobacteriota bacterium]